MTWFINKVDKIVFGLVMLVFFAVGMQLPVFIKSFADNLQGMQLGIINDLEDWKLKGQAKGYADFMSLVPALKSSDSYWENEMGKEIEIKSVMRVKYESCLADLQDSNGIIQFYGFLNCYDDQIVEKVREHFVWSFPASMSGVYWGISAAMIGLLLYGLLKLPFVKLLMKKKTTSAA
jgi:hypothetical protein